MKNLIGVLVASLILLIAIPITSASATVSVDKTTALPGETVTISGTAGADESILIKITDEAGNIIFFDGATADSSGVYNAAFVVPPDTAPGKLTVTAGSGSNVATTTINIADMPATPTPTITPSPTATPTASPTITPSPAPTPTASATVTPSPSAEPSASASSPPSNGSEDDPIPTDEGETAPTQTGTSNPSPVTPREISKNEETGLITVVIDVDILPEGTVALQTPDGDLLYVSDAEDGVLTFEVTEDEVNTNGQVELVALDDEMAPLAEVYVKVLDENEELVIAKMSDTGMPVWLIVVIIAAVLLVAAVLYFLLWRKQSAQPSNV